MEFFVYHRDRPGSLALRAELVEAHWAYMDRFADRMIARGPTFTGDIPTGSMHIVDLPDPAAARAFAFDEPSYQAGVYRDVLIRRWHRVHGGGTGEGDRYLVLGLGQGEAPPAPQNPKGLIAYGSLLSDDGAAWLGTAALTTAPAVLKPEHYAAIEVHNWTVGGRR
ncbi:YciI family protein [Paractinoplanes rishiriensis]|nr:YciI family protein [Actinoplanes rishiriensis]